MACLLEWCPRFVLRNLQTQPIPPVHHSPSIIPSQSTFEAQQCVLGKYEQRVEASCFRYSQSNFDASHRTRDRAYSIAHFSNKGLTDDLA
eukprot:7255131-Pyramimonas_sp.AAC.2